MGLIELPEEEESRAQFPLGLRRNCAVNSVLVPTSEVSVCGSGYSLVHILFRQGNEWLPLLIFSCVIVCSLSSAEQLWVANSKARAGRWKQLHRFDERSHLSVNGLS